LELDVENDAIGNSHCSTGIVVRVQADPDILAHVEARNQPATAAALRNDDVRLAYC
jgi:hypothetical protein